MTFRLIEAEKVEHSISRLCRVLGVSRVGFYAWRTRPPAAREQRDAELERLIASVFAESRETYGAPRVHAELQTRGVHVGKKRIGRLMRQLELEGCPGAESAAGAGSGQAPLRRRAARRALARRHHLPTDLRGLAVPRGRDGRLQPQDRRLGDAR